jgi:hypothetical protein
VRASERNDSSAGEDSPSRHTRLVSSRSAGSFSATVTTPSACWLATVFGVVQTRRELAREEDERLLRQRPERDRLLAGQQVIRRQDGHDGFGPDDLRGHVGRRLGTEREGDVDRSGPQRGQHLRVPHLLREQLDVGVTGPERPAERREGLVARAPAERQPQLADVPCSRTLGGHDGPVGLGERPPGPVEERATGLGERDLASAALEELCPELSLELADGESPA